MKKEEGESADVAKNDSSLLEAYKSILNSKTSEESLVRNLRFTYSNNKSMAFIVIIVKSVAVDLAEINM